MSRGHDPHARLLKSLERSARNYGVGATFSDFSETPWSSATFLHALADQHRGAAAQAHLARLHLALRRDADAMRLELLVLLEA